MIGGARNAGALGVVCVGAFWPPPPASKRPDDPVVVDGRPVAARLVCGGHAGGTVVLKLKTGNFKLLTRNRQLPNPTQKAEVIYQQAVDLIEREADGRYFRLVGIGVGDICPAAEADPPDLFGGLA